MRVFEVRTADLKSVGIQKVLWMTRSTKDFCSLPRSYSKCWYVTKTHVALLATQAAFPQINFKIFPKTQLCQRDKILFLLNYELI